MKTTWLKEKNTFVWGASSLAPRRGLY